MVRNRFLSKVLASLVLAAFVPLTTGCWGSYNLTRDIYNWNKNVSDNKWVVWLIHLPVLFISGSQGLDLAREHKDNLRDYVNQGGFLFAEASCAEFLLPGLLELAHVRFAIGRLGRQLIVDLLCRGRGSAGDYQTSSIGTKFLEQMTNHRHRRIVSISDSKYNLIVRIVLGQQSTKIVIQFRIQATARTNQINGGSEVVGRANL